MEHLPPVNLGSHTEVIGQFHMHALGGSKLSPSSQFPIPSPQSPPQLRRAERGLDAQ
jgi:hypothetical protein